MEAENTHLERKKKAGKKERYRHAEGNVSRGEQAALAVERLVALDSHVLLGLAVLPPLGFYVISQYFIITP